MKIIIVSDTHNKQDRLYKIIEYHHDADMLVHCGDVEQGQWDIMNCVSCPVHMVAGNNDYFCDLPQEKEFFIGKHKVFLTHGHNYYISMGRELLLDEAKARGADIVMFGHTHRPIAVVEGGVMALNPGSLTYPRQEGRRPSYIVMEVENDGEPVCTINYL